MGEPSPPNAEPNETSSEVLAEDDPGNGGKQSDGEVPAPVAGPPKYHNRNRSWNKCRKTAQCAFEKTRYFFSDPNRALVVFTGCLVLVGIFALFIQRDTEKRQLRSYVYVFPVTIVRFKPGTPPIMLLSMKNYGATPVRNGFVRFGFAISAPLPNVDYSVPEKDMTESREPIGFPMTGSDGRVPLRLEGKNTTSAKDFEKVRQNGDVLIIRGAFIYDDIFKIKRHTRFCYMLDWRQISSTRMSADKQLLGTSGAGYCKNGNEED